MTGLCLVIAFAVALAARPVLQSVNRKGVSSVSHSRRYEDQVTPRERTLSLDERPATSVLRRERIMRDPA